MGTTSSEVKRKYNNKVYKAIRVELKKELVGAFEEQLAKDGIKKAEFFRNAITAYLNQNNVNVNDAELSD